MKQFFLAVVFGYAASLVSTSAGIFWLPYAFVGIVALKALSESPTTYESVWFALALGFFFDIFSGDPRGLWTAGILLLALCVKYIARSYVRIPNT